MLIKEIKISHKGKTIYDCCFFSDSAKTKKNNHYTILIGENGIGKSHFSSLIIDVFRCIESNGSFRIKYDSFSVVFIFNDLMYKVILENKKIHFYEGENLVDRECVPLPQRLVAMAFMVNDKFTFNNNSYWTEGSRYPSSSDSDYDTYRYLGVRSSSNATYTSSIQKKIVNNLILIATDDKKIFLLRELLSFLGLDSKIYFCSYLKNKKLFSNANIDYQILLDRIISKKNIDSYKKSNIKNMMINDDIPYILASLENYLVDNNDGLMLEYCLDLSKDGVDIDFLRYISSIGSLEDLELLEVPKVRFSKYDVFDFNHSSSGEKHLIYSMTSLINSVDNESLVVIDEPELSLHPKWQNQYMNLLRSIGSMFSGVHFIISTHSHLMISDLDDQDSSLIVMEKDSQGVAFTIMDYSTYAWSAENILYKVFGLRSTRNFYFEADLADLLGVISGRINKNDIDGGVNKIIDRLERVKLGQNDPLVDLLKSAKEYLENDQKN